MARERKVSVSWGDQRKLPGEGISCVDGKDRRNKK